MRRSQNRTDAYDEAVSELLGINRTDHRCLDVLSQEGPVTPGRLAELMGLTSGAITTVLDRLERAGYVRRVRDQDDRRRLHVELTERVHEAVWPYYEPLARISEELYAQYSDDQLALILEFLETAAALFGVTLAELQAKVATETDRRRGRREPPGGRPGRGGRTGDG